MVIFCCASFEFPNRRKEKFPFTFKFLSIMYPIQTRSNELSEKMYEHILSLSNSGKNIQPDSGQNGRLHTIAGLSFDLLTRVQKWEKLYKMNQLSDKESREYLSTIRMVGIMIAILKQYQYSNQEMMQSLVQRFQRYDRLSHNAAA